LPDGVGFTDVEHWAWAQIIQGLPADMRFATGADDGAGDKAAELIEGPGGKLSLRPWPESRKLSALFFETVLFHEPWASARAKPWIRISNAWVEDRLHWSNGEVRDEFWLLTSRIEKQAFFYNTHFHRRFNLQGSLLFEGMMADSIQVDGYLFCCDGFRSEGLIQLVGGKIGGGANFIGATLSRGLSADGVEIGGDLFCRDRFCASERLNFIGARIRGDAQVRGELNCNVDFTGATIGGELQFDQGGKFPPVWGEKARLILRNVTCGALAGAIESFQRPSGKGKRTEYVPVDLLGLSYARIGGLTAEMENTRQGATLADAKPGALVAFLQSDAPRNGVFTPQPYRQLADALAAAGREELANKVRFELLEHERAAKGVPLPRKFALWLSRHLIGHGFASWRAALLFILVVIGTAATGLAFEGSLAAASWAEIDWRPIGDWGGYALGNAIPVVELDPSHETFIADRFGAEAPLWLKTVLYSSKLLGFLLLSYLAAGLTGFASRSARR